MLDVSNSPLAHFLGYLLLPAALSAKWFVWLVHGPKVATSPAWRSRLQFRKFVEGAPALAALAVVLWFGLFYWLRASHSNAAYATNAVAALRDHRFAEAAVASSRLLAEDPANPIYQYQLGLALAGQRQWSAAQELIGTLAPDDRLGFEAAHLWIAERVLTRDAELTPDDRRRIETHLLRIREFESYRERVDALLARYYFATARGEEVLQDERLIAGAKSNPTTHLELLELWARQGKADRVTTAAADLLERFQRRLQSKPDDETPLYIARTQCLLGDYAGAAATLQTAWKLHNQDRFGTALCRLAVARADQVLNDPGVAADERRRVLTEAEQTLLKFGTQSDDELLKRARIFRALEATDQAESLYRRLSESLPAVRAELADWYRRLGRNEDAEAEWRRLLDDVKNRNAIAAGSAAELRRLGALAAIALKRFEEAERMLAAPADPAIDQAQLAAMRGQLYLAWWDSFEVLKSDITNDTDVHADLLEKALEADPWNGSLLVRLLYVARSRSAPAIALREQLQNRIVDGVAPASAYLLLGADALERGDRTAARGYLDRAHRLNPRSAETLNNLAWLLYSDQPADIDTASALVEEAVRLAPQNLKIRDTRFRIYAKLGRWSEAASDLELCASVMADDPEFHRIAAEVYRQLRLPDLAERHQRRSELKMGVAEPRKAETINRQGAVGGKP